MVIQQLILFKIGELDARKICENIENTNLVINYNGDGWDEITAHKVRNEIYDSLLSDVNENDLPQIEVETLSDFMDRCNDEELNLDDYFISYVNAKMNEKNLVKD